MDLPTVFSVLTCAVMTAFSEETSSTISSYTNKRNSMPELKDNELYEAECPDEYASFCMQGHCMVLKSLGEPMCRCNWGFTGERCEHIILAATRVKEMEATHIAIGIGGGLLLSGLVAFIWFYRKKRCKKSAQTHVRCNIEETLPQVNILD